jgi:hypothetical protein
MAKTFLGENIGPDAKVLVTDVKVLVPEVKVLVPGCWSTGPWMCQIVSGNAAEKVRDIFEKNESLRLQLALDISECANLFVYLTLIFLAPCYHKI